MNPLEHRPADAAIAMRPITDFDCVDGPDCMTLVIDGQPIALTPRQREIVLLEARMAHA